MTKAKKAKNRPRNAKRASASIPNEREALAQELDLIAKNEQVMQDGGMAAAHVGGAKRIIAACEAGAALLRGGPKVYILFHETNTGRGDESDGYVEMVYATKEAADAACLAAIRKARDAGEEIWHDPDDEDDDGNTDWEHDWHVEEHEVKS